MSRAPSPAAPLLDGAMRDVDGAASTAAVIALGYCVAAAVVGEAVIHHGAGLRADATALRLFHETWWALHLVACLWGADRGAARVLALRDVGLDAVTLSGRSLARTVTETFAAAWTEAALPLVALLPWTMVAHVLGGMAWTVSASAALSLASVTFVSVALGMRVASRGAARDTARTVALLAGAALAAGVYLVASRALGAAVGGAYRVGVHGAVWWSEALGDGRLPTAVRRVVAWAPALVAAVATPALVADASVGCTSESPRPNRLARAAWIASLAVFAAAVPVVSHLARTPDRRAMVWSLGVALWSLWASVGIVARLDDDPAASRRRARFTALSAGRAKYLATLTLAAVAALGAQWCAAPWALGGPGRSHAPLAWVPRAAVLPWAAFVLCVGAVARALSTARSPRAGRRGAAAVAAVTVALPWCVSRAPIGLDAQRVAVVERLAPWSLVDTVVQLDCPPAWARLVEVTSFRQSLIAPAVMLLLGVALLRMVRNTNDLSEGP